MKERDILILGTGTEILCERRSRLRDDLISILQRLQSSEDPMPPKGKLGIIGRWRIRIDQKKGIRRAIRSTSLDLSNQHFSPPREYHSQTHMRQTGDLPPG